MIEERQLLKLQAFLDGELSEREAREVAAWSARDSEAADFLRELRNTRQALASFQPEARVPESREFYWSKIERGIQRLPAAPAQPQEVSTLQWLRRWLPAASAAAVLVIIGVVAVSQSGLWGPAHSSLTRMSSADSGAFTYQDETDGTTLVWLSYPAER